MIRRAEGMDGEQARSMNCANTYDEVRAKLLKKEDQ